MPLVAGASNLSLHDWCRPNIDSSFLPFGALNCQRHGGETVFWLAASKRDFRESLRRTGGLLLADIAVVQRVVNSGSEIFWGWCNHATAFGSKSGIRAVDCRSAAMLRIVGGRMGIQSEAAFQPNASFNFKPTDRELAEIRLSPSINDLITLVRANEDIVFSHARERAIDPLALRSRLLLNLPRLVTADGLPGERDIRQEILAVSDLLEEGKRKYAREYTRSLEPPERPITLADLEFGPLDADTAKMYHETFHYIGSYRRGQHFAFRDKNSGRIVCIGSVASFDLKHAEEKIAPHIDPRSVLVFSRFFAFRWAPKNTFSHFWGKLRRQMIEQHDTKLMFSFINPNVGFDARSHKAAQWMEFAHEEGTRYMYLDGRY